MLSPHSTKSWAGAVSALAVVATAFFAYADDDFNQAQVTYAKDVAPIMYQHCASCHRPGESAPMTLLSYDETRPWVKSIKSSISKGDMPPWHADPRVGHFANDISLTDKEVATIVKWVDQGAPEGDKAQTPPAPTFADGWQLGKPDYILNLDEVTVPATGSDYFPNMNVSIDIPDKHWLRAVEVHPGNRSVLHHIVLFTAGTGMASASGTFDALAVWAVGTGPVVYPEGAGRWVKPKMNVIANMHYHPSGTEQKDKTTVAFYWGQGDMQKEISSALAGVINFKIPPGAKDYRLSADYYVNQDVKIVSYFPHMHMRGKQMTFTAKYPDGREEKLLDVPRYDFNWQWFYYPQKDVILPEDTEIHIDAVYDNTKDNPNNPDPTRTLTFGEGSTDEMMFGFLEFVPVEGVKPKPINAEKKLAKMTAKLSKDDVYQVNSSMGFMSMKTRVYLPKDGSNGTWYFTFGGSVMPIDLTDLKWNGNDFAFNMEFFGGRFGMKMKASGKVDEEGKLEGHFDFDEAMLARMEEFNRNSGVPAARKAEAEAQAKPEEGQEKQAQAQGEEGEGHPRQMGRGRGGMGAFMRDFKGTRAS